MNWKIPLFKIYRDKKDIKMVSRVIASGKDWAIGEYVELFERKIAEYVGVKYALVFNSGTSALHALMMSYNLNDRDEIIVPSFTFIATANAPLFVGAKPVFAEIEPETFGIDPLKIESKITNRTKMILPIHFGGCACKIVELEKIAKKHNLILIEDAAESLGARVKDKQVGTFGEAAIFSFCPPKVISTGEGGAVVTNSKKIYETLKLLRSHGRAETKNYFSSSEYMDYLELGYNFRMSNILAALGVSQIEKIEKIIKLRKQKASYLSQKLKLINGIILPNPPRNYSHIYQMYTIYIKQGKETRDILQKYLNKNGIMAKVYFPCVHLSYFYRKKFGYRKGDLPVTEKISDRVLTLPMYPDLKRREIDFMARKIIGFFNG